MAVPFGFVERKSRRHFAWVRSDLQTLDAALLWAVPTPLAAARGRGGVGTLQLGSGLVAVARPFRRGGAFGKMLGDRYQGPARVCREVSVLCALRELGVPVVTPLAALAQRPRTFWRLRLLTALEASALPLPEFCRVESKARRWAIEAAGVTVRLAFAAGLLHPDLHPDNLLCSLHGEKVRAVLVDLDRAAILPTLTHARRDAMLVRMGRYLHRHRARLGNAFSAADHLRFLRALGLDKKTQRATWLRLAAQLHRALRRRRLI
ncbi:hypothetical protein LBMAG49_16690 [Planctomycetota bacterium]|nr:hypothetical protein LBMAG49_16690 [Planctomycetota bacterium]